MDIAAEHRLKIRDLIAERKAGHALPREFYNSDLIYQFDLETIFERKWLQIGFTCELPKPGSYVAMTIGRSPIVIVKDRAGEIKGYFNSCRHRGAQICADGAGRKSTLVCPYHQWTYGLDGKLMQANAMPEDFDPSAHSLKPLHVQVVAGAIFVCLAENPPAFDGFRASLEPSLGAYNLQDAKLAYEYTLVEKANWKLVMENGRECYHCAACHPELGVSFPIGISPEFAAGEEHHLKVYKERMESFGFDIGPNDGPWWQVASFPLNENAKTISLDGNFAVKTLLNPVNGGDLGSLRFAIEPHNFTHVLGDYLFMFSCYPTGPEETIVVGKWLVHKDAVEGVDYTVDSLIAAWDITNRQDRDLAENNQRGVNGRGYIPGPYSPTAESLVLRFTDWYSDEVAAAVGANLVLVDAVA